MESVFARGDRGAEKYQFSNELYDEKHPKKKKAKKIQKDVYRRNTGIAPPAYDISSVYTGKVKGVDIVPDSNDKTNKERRNVKKRGKKVIFDICNCDQEIDENNKGKYVPKTWESLSKFYGNTDTTEVWNSKNEIIKAYNGNYKTKQLYDDLETGDNRNDLKKRINKQKVNSKTQKKLPFSKKHSNLNEKDQKRNPVLQISHQNPNGTSVISLFRNNNKKQKKDSKFQNYHKERFSTITATGEICDEGPCKEAAKAKNKLFHCKCEKKRVPEIMTKNCTDATCKVLKNAPSVKSIVKMKDKFLCLCHKYSQKIVNFKPHASTCEDGVCREAEINHKYDFNCKCDKNRINNECTDKTCGKYTKTNIDDIKTHINNQEITRKKSFSLHYISAKVGLLQNVLKQKKTVDDNKITLEHEGEQTGEPFFEVQVNPRDMCVLNPIDIRENILKYGKPGWNDLKCICPSRGVLKRGEVCASGVCKKAYKHKQTNFKCWCDKRLTECGDTTCGVVNVNIEKRGKKKKYGRKIITPRVNKPLLEVKLDRDKMCVVNPREIGEKMVNNLRVDDVCYAGICRNNAKDGLPHFCKCVGRKMMSDITECAEDTCTGAYQKKKWSKSDNWSFRNKNRNQKRPTRSSFYEIGPNKLCRGKICSKSDNLYSNKTLNLNSTDMKHLPICNCEECKLQKKNTSSPKDTVNNTVNKSFKNNVNHTVNNAVKNTVNNTTNNAINNKTIEGIMESQKKNRVNMDNNLIENKVIDQPYKTASTITCTCTHTCECSESDEFAEFKYKDKMEREKLALKMRNKKINQRMSLKEMKRRAKLDKKREKQAAKERMNEIRDMQKKMKEEPLEANFCTAFLLGILKIVLRSVIFVLSIIISILTDPKGSFWYVRDRVMDPNDTFNKFKKFFSDALLIKKLQIIQTIRGSDTLTILADEFLDSPIYQSFADKGKTKKDQMMFEQKSKTRKRRIRKRQQQAIYSCRHNLLTTLRKTPCLWVYHICPNFYPQCLGLLAFMRNFSHILLFLVAFTCWTPCILSFELCRAILCCFMCTN